LVNGRLQAAKGIVGISGGVMRLTRHDARPRSVRDGSIIEKYRHYFREQNLFVETFPVRSCRGERLRLELPPGRGSGWAEMIQMDRGLAVGLCDYQFDTPVAGRYFDINAALGFNLLLSGCCHIITAQTGKRTSVRGGDLWLRHGPVGNLRYEQPAGCVMRGMSIELPTALIETWLDGAPDELARTLEGLIRHAGSGDEPPIEGFFPLVRPSRNISSITRTATRLLATPRDTICGELQFESLVLDLLSQLLSRSFPIRPDRRSRRQSAVDEAVDILREEWSEPPTIAALARRVGLNECYLEAEFRQRTGLSIGEFVRKLRMEKALELIESGECSILQVALSVGYSNPSHFSAAFKRFYGRLPSSYLARP
jgi:AraC-like DNA-binding protein